MPLMSALVEQMARLNNNTIRANVRYCDVKDRRHKSCSDILCSFASPEITALVAEEHRHQRIREDGFQSTHYSFKSLQNASLLLRLNKRYESIDNDRQENIVDILSEISNRCKEFVSIVPLIGDSIKDSINSCSDKLLDSTDRLNDKLGHTLNEMSSIKTAIQETNSSVEHLEGREQINVLDVKQELIEIKHQMSQMKVEIQSLKEAIVETLPEKLSDMFNMLNMTTIETTQIGSDGEDYPNDTTISE